MIIKYELNEPGIKWASICLSVRLSGCQCVSVCCFRVDDFLSVCLSVFLSVCLSVCLSASVYVCVVCMRMTLCLIICVCLYLSLSLSTCLLVCFCLNAGVRIHYYLDVAHKVSSLLRVPECCPVSFYQDIYICERLD